MIPATRNFIGLEFNKEMYDGEFYDHTHQMHVTVANNILIGIVTGIPIDKSEECLRTFLQLIYASAHRIQPKGG